MDRVEVGGGCGWNQVSRFVGEGGWPLLWIEFSCGGRDPERASGDRGSVSWCSVRGSCLRDPGVPSEGLCLRREVRADGAAGPEVWRVEGCVTSVPPEGLYHSRVTPALCEETPRASPPGCSL